MNTVLSRGRAIFLCIEELSLKNTCLCRTLSYKDNDLHLNLGFKCSLQTMVSTLNRNLLKSVLHRQNLYHKKAAELPQV